MSAELPVISLVPHPVNATGVAKDAWTRPSMDDVTWQTLRIPAPARETRGVSISTRPRVRSRPRTRLHQGSSTAARVSIHKLVAIAAIAAGDLDYEDPTKHPRVGVTLQAIRRRLSTDQDQATPLTSQRLLQVLLSIDTATVAGIRDVAVLLVGWYGALRRSELAGLGRDHLSLEADGLVLQLPQSKASPDHSV